MTSTEQHLLPFNRAPLTAARVDDNANQFKLTRKGKVALWGAGTILTVAGAGVVGNSLHNHAQPEFTPKQLSQFDTHNVTLESGEGYEQAIKSVDPGLANDAQGLSEVKSFVEQAVAAANPQYGTNLQAHESVPVPVIPSETNAPSAK